MSTQTIGTIIAKLRKEKGVTQEELAKAAQVSTQAVSKWENGGVPDTDLLPRIADYFAVSIDTLFGRSLTDYGDIEGAIGKHIQGIPENERMGAGFNLCRAIERAFFGDNSGHDNNIKVLQEEIGDTQWQSRVILGSGFTSTGLSQNLSYFLLVPELADKQKGFFDGIDYTGLFKDLSDKAVFDTLVFMNRREKLSMFTTALLIKNLGITAEKATEVIKILQEYDVIRTSNIEMDDENKEIHYFNATPSFPSLLIFAREMIKSTTRWRYNSDRERVYLK
jgi:transcriptional regulator with XRE-family HTH domain